MDLRPDDYLDSFPATSSKQGRFYSLPALERRSGIKISTLPVSIRIVLESVLRHCDGTVASPADVLTLANWPPEGVRNHEVPFVVARVLLQDFTGVPLGVDLAAMRSAVAATGRSPGLIEPLVPVDLVIDHSVQVDFSRIPDAYARNIEMEFKRNHSRYEFLKWCRETFKSFNVIPPGIGICHQVNLEYLAQGVIERDGVYFPDTLVGTDSHTTMINGIGVVGWGVGGIEAEAAMLGQPVYFLTPDVVGVHLTGSLREGVTATDLVLRITELLRKAKVVGKFVEFHGTGAASLPAPDRATIANMAPEYGATIGFFPVDDRTCDYLLATGRTAEQVETFRNYYRAQGIFGIPSGGSCRYSQLVELDLASVEPSVAGPKRPQDRIPLTQAAGSFAHILKESPTSGGYGKGTEQGRSFSTETGTVSLHHGDVVIAAITSCTNTSNPSVMLAAGLLAKKAVERGLTVRSVVKTSLAPGSRVVTDYLTKTGLLHYFEMLGFGLVGYGCTTCIGNSGPLDPAVEELIVRHDIVAASVLSGNRNFEARVHQSVKANFLMSPPLVVAYALAGSVLTDLTKDPLGTGSDGSPVYLKDIWPSLQEVSQAATSALEPGVYRDLYRDIEATNDLWTKISVVPGEVYQWDRSSTYIQEPPYFEDFRMEPAGITDIVGARALAIFGDSVTTDHISPAGAIKAKSAAGRYLLGQGVQEEDFNSYGARRGNHHVMVRGTFANVRIKNLMLGGTEGGFTTHYPTGDLLEIYDAATRYQADGVPLVIIAGQEYGTGSSRDWAAKGTKLLGVKAVVTQSFERIHRSNLVGMGILPCQFLEGTNALSLGLSGQETFTIRGLEAGLKPQQELGLSIRGPDGSEREVPVLLRIDTPIEIEYYRHGGILPFVLRQLLARP